MCLIACSPPSPKSHIYCPSPLAAPEWHITSLLHSVSVSLPILSACSKKCTTSELWVVFYLGQNEDYLAQETASCMVLRTTPKGWGEGQHIRDFGEGEVRAIKHTFFCRRFLVSWGAIVTMKDFSALLDMRRFNNWVHKISSWKDLSEDLFRQVFPEHRGSYFCPHPELLSRGVESQQLLQHVI